MKKHFLQVLLLSSSLLIGCQSSKEEYISPYQTTLQGLNATSLPGAISFTWDTPEDKDFAYTELRYLDLASGETITQSFAADEKAFTAEDLLAKYGEYTFYFTVYNQKSEAGPTIALKKECLAVDAWTEISEKTIKLTAARTTTNAKENLEGSISALFDDDPTTFFVSNWSSQTIPTTVGYHHLAFDLNREVAGVKIQYQNRSSNTNPNFVSYLERVNIKCSTDGENWTPVTALTDLPKETGSTYTSEQLKLPFAASHIQFEVTNTNNIYALYFGVAEIKMWEIIYTEHNPENE